MADIQAWFNHVDRDRSGVSGMGMHMSSNFSGTGHIDAHELQAALQLGQLNFSLQLCARMIRLHDNDGSGTIDFAEFSQLHHFLISCQQSFHTADRDRSGSLSKSEVYAALGAAGFRIDAPAYDALFLSFDPDRSGCLKMDEFIAACVTLQGLSRVFRAFDAQNSGRVTLNFDQACYFVAKVL